MKTLLLTGQIAASLLGPGAGAPPATGPAATEVTQAPERLALSRAAEPAVRIELSVAQALSTSVKVPHDPQVGDVTVPTTTRPGPSGPGWGVSLRVFVRLPRGAGRLEVANGLSPFVGEDFNKRDYAPSAPVSDPSSGSPSPDSPATWAVSGHRSYNQGFFSLGWSRDLWLRRSWALRGEAGYRAAFISRTLYDEVVGAYGSDSSSDNVEKRYEGARAGLVLRAPLLGGATVELGAGCALSSVSETCEGCAADGTDISRPRRVEALPDLALRVRIPAGDHIEMTGGYRWESWGRDSFDNLRTSGVFFSLGVLIGPGRR